MDNSSDSWRRSVIGVDATLQQVITNLDATALQIALVTADNDKLIGTVTDGDVRRGLLRGLNLGDSIGSIIHREPLLAPSDLDRDSVLMLMKINRIHQLPVVDEARRVKGMYLWDELMAPSSITTPMIIMAGGQGMRLRPHTDNCPKPLLKVGNKPILEHIIERSKAEGFTRFIIAIHYLGEMIEQYFGDGSKWQVEIDYLREETPLGTAGAISLLNPEPREPFIITNGDVLTDIRYGDLVDYHCQHNTSATMAVRMHEWQHPYGVVSTKGLKITGFEEKPISRSYVNTGIYVLEPETLALLNKGQHCDMPELFGRIRESNAETIVYPMHEPWLDVGLVDDFEKAQNSYIGRSDD